MDDGTTRRRRDGAFGARTRHTKHTKFTKVAGHVSTAFPVGGAANECSPSKRFQVFLVIFLIFGAW
jgi:hypothetical protein